METDTVGDKIGRIHLGRQNLDDLQTRKMKGLKRSRDMENDDPLSDVEVDTTPDRAHNGANDDTISLIDDFSDEVDEDGGVAVKKPRLGLVD